MCPFAPQFEQAAAWGSPHSRSGPQSVRLRFGTSNSAQWSSIFDLCVSSAVNWAEKAICKRQLASAKRSGGCSRGYSPDSVRVQFESCRCKECSIRAPKQNLINLIAKTECNFPACTGEYSRNPDAKKAGSKSLSLHWHNCKVLEEIHASSWVVVGSQENGQDWWNCGYSYCECRAGGTDWRSKQTDFMQVFLACQLITFTGCCCQIEAWQHAAAAPTLHGSLFLHQATQEFGVRRRWRIGSKCEGNPAAQVCRTRKKLALLEHECMEPVLRRKLACKFVIFPFMNFAQRY